MTWFDVLTVASLLVLVVCLEHLHTRPFLATRAGHVLAWLLRGRRVPKAGYPHTLYEVSWLPAVGFRAVGQTWGEVVLVVRGYASVGLLAHEACHVGQFRRYSSFGLWCVYLGGWLRGLLVYRSAYRAYWSIPLEDEARAAADLTTQQRVREGADE